MLYTQFCRETILVANLRTFKGLKLHCVKTKKMTNFRYVGMSKPTSSMDTRGEFLEKRWGLLLKIIGKEQSCFYRIKGPELKASETKVEIIFW